MKQGEHWDHWRTAAIVSIGVALVASSLGLVALGNLAVTNRELINGQRARISQLETQIRSLGAEPVATTATPGPTVPTTTTIGRRPTTTVRPTPRTTTATTVHPSPPSSGAPGVTGPPATPVPSTSSTTTSPTTGPLVCIHEPPIVIC